jgi:Lon protease-like protein
MQVGNARYRVLKDFPGVAPVFPLTGALLLPGSRMPLNIFEPRYLAMIDASLAGPRVIGMVQPSLDGRTNSVGEPQLSSIGCLGRITSLTETGDGRYVLALDGICRFRLGEEIVSRLPYRQCHIAPMLADLEQEIEADQVDRISLLKTLRDYVDANGFQVDWDNISRAGNATLVNALSMMAPYGPAEKQALLEAPDLKTRAAMLVALAEIELARDGDGPPSNLQ